MRDGAAEELADVHITSNKLSLRVRGASVRRSGQSWQKHVVTLETLTSHVRSSLREKRANASRMGCRKFVGA